MPEIPITFTGTLDIKVHCSSCHQSLEATIIVAPEQTQIIVAVDTEHKCKLPTKVVFDKII